MHRNTLPVLQPLMISWDAVVTSSCRLVWFCGCASTYVSSFPVFWSVAVSVISRLRILCASYTRKQPRYDLSHGVHHVPVFGCFLFDIRADQSCRECHTASLVLFSFLRLVLSFFSLFFCFVAGVLPKTPKNTKIPSTPQAHHNPRQPSSVFYFTKYQIPNLRVASTPNATLCPVLLVHCRNAITLSSKRLDHVCFQHAPSHFILSFLTALIFDCSLFSSQSLLTTSSSFCLVQPLFLSIFARCFLFLSFFLFLFFSCISRLFYFHPHAKMTKRAFCRFFMAITAYHLRVFFPSLRESLSTPHPSGLFTGPSLPKSQQSQEFQDPRRPPPTLFTLFSHIHMHPSTLPIFFIFSKIPGSCLSGLR